jgi:hypothetical protein
MNAPRSSATAPKPPLGRAIGSIAEAEQVVAELTRAMDGLLGLVEQETQIVRSGRLFAAATLGAAKSDLVGTYLAAAERLKANAPFLRNHMRTRLDDVRRRHDVFRGHLQLNLTVLATAHAVSEGIVRGVAGEMARKAAPRVYGASGRAAAPAGSAASPIAVSRSL